MLFLELVPPTLQNSGIPEFFTIAPVLTSTLTVCCRNRRRLYTGLKVRYKYYKTHSRFGLAWSRPRADRGLSRPTSDYNSASFSKLP